jgi:hypothetical protein
MKRILPDILPPNPKDAIKGTELIQLVKYRLNQEYSDATLRYHFSIMCCDPSSPIAKVEQGQGYYLRSYSVGGFNGEGIMAPTQPSLEPGLFEQAPGNVDLAITRARKFRAVVQRVSTGDGQFPFAFEGSFSSGAPRENLWKFPDLALVSWHVLSGGEAGGDTVLDRASMAVRAAAGLPAFSITTAKLKMNVTHANFRESFFQCVSHSAWANAGALHIAGSITDGQLAGEVRSLGAHHGIGVTTYGLTPEGLDHMPDTAELRKLRESEFDALLTRLDIRILSPSRQRPAADWAAIEAAAGSNADAAKLTGWLAKCLETGRV